MIDMRLELIKSVAVPQFVKVAGYYLVSGALMGLVNNVGQLHLSPFAQLIVAGVINAVLAGLKKMYDANQVI